jgi:hypothetical protein
MRDRVHLFAVSLFVLFLELAAIRWFPAQVLFLTFFTNTVLLACFLGMSIGCLAADRPRHYIAWTPALLAIALGAARGIEWWRERSGAAFGVGNVASPQLVFFGTESRSGDPSQFVLPIELVAGVLSQEEGTGTASEKGPYANPETPLMRPIVASRYDRVLVTATWPCGAPQTSARSFADVSGDRESRARLERESGRRPRSSHLR